MRPEEFYLRDILFACKSAKDFAGEIDRATFKTSLLYQAAIQFNLLIMGEAAGSVSRGLKSRHPEVEWRSLSEFRNVLAHDYFALDLDVVWDSAVNNAVTISGQIREILHTEFPDFAVPEDI